MLLYVLDIMGTQNFYSSSKKKKSPFELSAKMKEIHSTRTRPSWIKSSNSMTKLKALLCSLELDYRKPIANQ